MKRIIFSILLAAGVYGGEMPVADSLEGALSVAKREGRTILLTFTGKEWCPACIHLRTKIFASEEFKDQAGDRYVGVEVIFPRQPEAVKALGEEKLRDNEQMLNEYHITSGFPTMVLHDENGLPFATVVGTRRTPAEFIAALEKAQKVRKQRDTLLARADGKQGMERAKALAEAMRVVPENLRFKYTDIVNEINALDPENTLGFKNVLVAPKLYAQQLEALYQLTQGFVGHLTPEEQQMQVQRVQDFIQNTPDLQPEVAQLAWRIKSEIHALRREYEQMAADMQRAVDAAPNSDLAPRLRASIEHYEKNIRPRLENNTSREK